MLLGQLRLSLPSLRAAGAARRFVEGGSPLYPGQRRRKMQLSSAFRSRFVLNSGTELWEEGSCWCSKRSSPRSFGEDAAGRSRGEPKYPRQHYPVPKKCPVPLDTLRHRAGTHLPCRAPRNQQQSPQDTIAVRACPLPGCAVPTESTLGCKTPTFGTKYSAVSSRRW